MTYAELLEALYELSPSQLQCDITVECNHECYPAKLVIVGEIHDSLDETHPLIILMRV